MDNTSAMSLIEMMLDGQLISTVEHQRILEDIRSADLPTDEALLNHVAPDIIAFAKRGLEYGVSCVRLENIEPDLETTRKDACRIRVQKQDCSDSF